MSDHVDRALKASRKATNRAKLIQDQYPSAYMPGVGRQVMQLGGVPDGYSESLPTQDVMAGTSYVSPQDPSKGPGLYDKAMSVVSKVAEPVKDVAETYMKHTGKAAREGSELMTEANRAARMQEGRLPINAAWQYPLGALQLGFAPLTGAAQTAGEYATKATGDPTFGAKVALAGEFVDPTHAGMIKKMLPGVLAAVPPPGMVPKAASVAQEASTVTAPAHQTTPLGFYSHAAEVAGGLKQAVKPQDAVNWITKQPGVRKEELVAAGIIDDMGRMTPEFAAMPRVDAQTLSERIRTGAPDVEETVLPLKPTQLDPRYKIMSLEEAKERFPDEFIKGEYGPYVLVGPTGTGPYASVRPLMEANDPSEFLANFGLGSKYGPDAYPELTTPGGTNYREVVMRLPERPHDVPEVYVSNHPMLRNESFKSLEDMYAKVDELLNHIDDARRTGGLDDESYARMTDLFKLDELRDRKFYVHKEVDQTKNVDPNLRYFSHFPEQINPVLHMRMQDVLIPGKNQTALRIEEIQSDWAQQGRKRGFRPTEAQVEESKKAVEELKARMAENEVAMIRTYGDNDDEYNRLNQESVRLREEMARHGMVLSNRSGRLPSAPYVGDTQYWTDLGVKRALLEAANKDYGSIQFIKGDVNRKRYSGGDSDEDYGYHYDVNVPASLKRMLKKIDPDAKVQSRRSADFDQAAYDDMQKEYDQLAQRRREINNQYDDQTGDWETLSFELYDIEDEMFALQSKMKALATPDEFWEVEMTPKLREAIKQGLPRFASGGVVDDDAPTTVPEEPKKSLGGAITGWMNFNARN